MKFKDNNITRFRIFEWNQHLSAKGYSNAVNELIDQDMIPDLQRLLHGPGRYFKGLHDERPDEQGQQGRHNENFNILS